MFFYVLFWLFLFMAQARSFQIVHFSLFWLACKLCIPKSGIVWKLGLTHHYSFFLHPKAPQTSQQTSQPAANYPKTNQPNEKKQIPESV